MLGRRRPDDALEALTERQREVLALMAEGLSNARDRERPGRQRAGRREHISTSSTPWGSTGEDGHRRVLAVLTSCARERHDRAQARVRRGAGCRSPGGRQAR